MALKPDFGPNYTSLPPLPAINSEAIRIQVFTHRSFYGRPTHIFEDHPDDPSPDNEKFEHLGDTVLGLVVTALMLEMYPGLRVGPSTKIRALMVGNATLAEISLMYKLPDRLRLHPAQALTLRASTNVQADVFESFIGGLYMDQGLDSVRNWLSELFRPYAYAAYHLVRSQHGLPPPTIPSTPTPSHVSDSLHLDALALTTIGHLALFNQHLQKANRQVEWVYSSPDNEDSMAEFVCGPGAMDAADVLRGAKTTPVWFVKVVVDGMYFGKGKGNTKKAARNDAAKEGLEKLGIHVW